MFFTADAAPHEPSSSSADEWLEPEPSFVSCTLPTAAETAYEMFLDVPRLPEWLMVVRDARIAGVSPSGSIVRATYYLGGTRVQVQTPVDYRCDPRALTVSWRTSGGGTGGIAGSAQFVHLSERACLMNYSLDLDMPESLLRDYPGHPTSNVLNDFRNFVSRSVH